MKRFLIPLLAAGALSQPAAWADDGPPPGAGAPKPVSDAQLSLYPGSLFEVPNPAGFAWNGSDPGDNHLLARAFPSAPPRVPHSIADFEPITLRANACLDCHGLEPESDAPALPVSHRTDFRRTPEKPGTEVAGARWQCLACHVGTTDAEPLRANSAAPR